MMRSPRRRAVASLAAALASLPCFAGGVRADWVASWSAAPATLPGPVVSGQTVRQYLRLSLGGAQLRVRFSNETGTDTLVISDAHLALPGSAPGAVDPASDRALTFGGVPSVRVTRGAPVLSDPVDLPVQALSTVAVTALFVTASRVQVGHLTGGETAFLLPGDHGGDTALSGAATTTSRYYLSGVDVSTPGQAGAAVGTLGDSITDGQDSTVDRDRRWTDRLAERFVGRVGGPVRAVVNGGISGNAVTDWGASGVVGASAPGRFDRDVLGRAGLRWLVVFEGINDIIYASPGQAVADDLIAGYRQIIARAHDRGIRVFGATLTPFAGAGAGYFSGAGERAREAVNRWIRDAGEFDGVVDFDAVLRDPARPIFLRPAYDSGDHLHPNDAGYRALGDSVPLGLFQ